MGIEYLLILLVLLMVGVLAGFVDTLAGGGGMVTLPSLMLAGLPPDAALATNKLQGSFGTVSATWYFVRRGQIQFRVIWPGILASTIGAALGTITVQVLPKDWLQNVIPVLLFAIALIFVFMPKLGEVSSTARWSMTLFSAAAIVPIGFYDGFIGPGTGSFFLLALIALRGKKLSDATIEAKAYNATTNFVSLFVFMLGGKIVWIAGLCMASGQIIGARIASGMIVSKGNRIIRPMVIVMSMVMSVVLAYRYWF